MKKTIRKLAVFDSYDFDLKESWLNQMAAEGYLLEKDGTVVYRFAASDNRSRRYSIIPKAEKDITQEELDLYQEQGWLLFSGTSNNCIFYTDEEDAPDLFTDEESYKTYLAKTLRSYLKQVVCSIVLALTWGCNLYFRLPGNQTSLEVLTDKSMISEISYIFVLAAIIVLQLLQGFRFFRARRRILQGVKRECLPKTYRKKWLQECMREIMIIVILVALVLSLAGGSKLKRAEAMAYTGDSPVMLRVLSPNEWTFVSAHTGAMEGKDSDVRYGYALRKVSNLTLREGYEEEIYVKEWMGYDDWELPEYTSMTYDFRSEKTAEKMLLKEIGYDTGCNSDAVAKEAAEIEIPVSVAGIDYVGYSGEQGDWQYLYLRKGTKVVYASYCGEADLLEALPLFEKQLFQESPGRGDRGLTERRDRELPGLCDSLKQRS